MLNALFTNSTLAFDSFGDIIIEHNDLKVNKNLNAKLQILTDYFRTNYTDYIFFPSYGANYDKYIGKAIDYNLISEILNKVKTDVKKLGILENTQYDVYAKQLSANTIQIRVLLEEDDDYTIYLDIDKINGVTVG